ncbi:MAG: glucokinase [Burkholderiaceae bacterium]|jgi:glucokinase|nr:glucokinase [Burkholderiaceae bacterium]
MENDFPRLLSDIGGTNARFVLETSCGHFGEQITYVNRSFSCFSDVLSQFLSQHAGRERIRHAIIAVAANTDSVAGSVIRMTNLDWTLSVESIQKEFGFETVLFVNDFTALAMSIPFMAPAAVKQCGGQQAVRGKPIGLLGAGTGLGVSGLIPCADTWVPLVAEGGHVSFPPFDEKEMLLLRLAREHYPHVSVERFLSGSGMALIYRLLMESRGERPESLSATEITHRALVDQCVWCDEVVETFCRMLGTVAGNLALTLGAGGGIYIGGGIVPHLGERFFHSGFRQRFEEKGRFSEYMALVPVFVILDTYAALHGASVMLSAHLRASAPH